MGVQYYLRLVYCIIVSSFNQIILICDSYWEMTSKDFFKTVRLTEGFSLMIIKAVRCPSYGGVRFIESFIIINPTLKRLVPAKSVHFMEVSVSRELTVGPLTVKI